MKTTIHTTIGLYNNMTYKINGVLNEDLDIHINYNKQFRFGRALFVDGKCVHEGTLSKEKLKEFENIIRWDTKFRLTEHTYPYV